MHKCGSVIAALHASGQQCTRERSLRSLTTHVSALGRDLAKGPFDGHLLAESRVSSHHFGNPPHGFEALDQWLKPQGSEQVPACMQATGTYGDAASPLLVAC